MASSRPEELPAASIRLDEPSAEEVVVVINANAAFGNHAGLFVGRQLSDPAGSYVAIRRRVADWEPGLADYVRFQTVDGPHIRSYRFPVDPATRTALLERFPQAADAAPLFCATAVQNVLAGIGPFASLPATGWTSPASVATLLDRLLALNPAAGRCQLPDASPCRMPPDTTPVPLAREAR